MRIFAAVLLAVALLSVLFSLTMFPAEKPVWEVVKLDDKNFPISYNYNGCTVSPRSDSTGVVLSAGEENGKGQLVSTVVIKKNKDGKVERTITMSVTKEDGTIHPYDHKYDIFAVKCMEVAKKLPSKVRDLFFGYYVNQ
jgi:hypothetical protein